MSPALIIVAHLVAWVWVVWSMGMMLRLRRENALLAAAVEETTARLQAMNARGLQVVGGGRRGRPQAVLFDAEGRN